LSPNCALVLYMSSCLVRTLLEKTLLVKKVAAFFLDQAWSFSSDHLAFSCRPYWCNFGLGNLLKVTKCAVVPNEILKA